MRQRKPRGLLLGVGIASVLLCAELRAQAPKVIEDHGHLSPVRVKVMFVNGKIREALLVGIGQSGNYLTHVFPVVLDAGTTPRRIWLDNIASIRGTDLVHRLTNEFPVIMKDGTEVRVAFDSHNGAARLQDWTLEKHLHLRYEDDSLETVDLLTVKQVDFLGLTRKDKAGNAIFDHWQYSPYTGERLLQ